MRPTFAGFSVAKRGLDAARANLQVTGQNITNVHSIGYTRQRIDLYSVGASGVNMRYSTKNDIAIGEGVTIGGINQIRDPYLDVRYRSEHANIGETVAKLDSLKELEYVFDEIMKDGVDKQFSDLVKQFQNLASNPENPLAESIVRTSASMLMKMFNSCSEQINVIKDQQLDYFKNNAIKNANELLSGIATLNTKIKNAHISGDPALELLDQRNVMIDELSQYANIQVSSKKVDIGGGKTVEELSISLVAPGNKKFNLVNDNEFRQFELATDPATGDVKHPTDIKLINSNGTDVSMSDDGSIGLTGSVINSQLSTGAFSGYLQMLNSKGEFDNPPSNIRGVGYYEDMLDTLVHDFADTFNKANSSNTTPPYDKPLFESNDGGKITAGNIQISDKWQKTAGSYITASKTPSADGSVSNDNILHMISLFEKKNHFAAPGTSTPLFHGSFQDCFTNISSTLALEIKEVDRQYASYDDVLTEIHNQRLSISSVNIDEEGINLIQYNQSLTAASRYMTTLDEALETIISRMGLVGR